MLVLVFATTIALQAQYTSGMTGMLNIPTAECDEAGSVKLGANMLPTSMVPNLNVNYKYTYNYFATISFFTFLELNYRATLLKTNYMSEDGRYNQQDRTYSIKARVLKEGKYRPAIALGANDPFADLGKNYYAAYYGVLTKSINFRDGGELSASFGYKYRALYDTEPERRWHDGLFGGARYTPWFYKDLDLMAEYDTEGVNVGAAVLLWRHLAINCFTRDFNTISVGLRYEGVLIH